jgi:hypothetical protein
MSLKFLNLCLVTLLLASQISTEETPAETGQDPATGGDTPADPANVDGDANAGANPAATGGPMKKLILCKRHLLENFKLEGKIYAEEMTLDMCGGVTNSCCTVKDQMTIYDNWVRDEEGKKLTDRLEYHFTVYSELILELEKAVPIASTLGSKHKEKGVIKNCKLLAEKVGEYNINMIGPKIKESVRAMHAFLQDTYKGVYCSICNAEYHEFFHTEKKTVNISPQFCRSIISNSLHVFNYYHVHLKKLMNLVSIMLTSCDKDANFMHGVSVPVELNFVVDDEDERELKDCTKNIDSPKWWAYCGRFCEEFNLSTFSEFFQPDLKKYKKMTKYLRTKFDKFLEEEKKSPESPPKDDADKAPEAKKEEKKNERILSRKIYRDRYLEDAAPQNDNQNNQDNQDNKNNQDNKSNKSGEGEGNAEGEQDPSEENPEDKPDGGEPEKKKEEEEVKVDPNDLKPTNIMDLTVEWEDLSVIRKTINGASPLEKYESYCATEGIDPYELGKQAQINDAVYETVKQKVAEMNKKPEPKPAGPKTAQVGFFTSMKQSIFG